MSVKVESVDQSRSLSVSFFTISFWFRVRSGIRKKMIWHSFSFIKLLFLKGLVYTFFMCCSYLYALMFCLKELLTLSKALN